MKRQKLSPSMKYSRIDKAILSVASRRWLKVARVLLDAARVEGIDLSETEQGLRIIVKRIEALVSQGRLDAQGDLRKWRHSEVRLPARSRRHPGRARSPLRAALPCDQLTRKEALRRLRFFTSGVRIGCERYGLDWAPEPLGTLSDFVQAASRKNPDWKRLKVLRKRLSDFNRSRKLLNESAYIWEYADIICQRGHEKSQMNC
jgi:hypothetical protein